MHYAVQTSGRLLLPEHLEPQALTVLEVELAAKQGAFGVEHDVDSLGELARFVGVAVRRHGDWLDVATDPTADPQWSDQATAFYVGLARWVTEGEIDVVGQDGGRWSYRYGPDGVIQIGQNGFDGSLTPFGQPAAPPGPPAVGAPGGLPEEPRPSRTLAMTLLLIVGVILIVGVAMLGAGIAG